MSAYTKWLWSVQGSQTCSVSIFMQSTICRLKEITWITIHSPLYCWSLLRRCSSYNESVSILFSTFWGLPANFLVGVPLRGDWSVYEQWPGEPPTHNRRLGANVCQTPSPGHGYFLAEKFAVISQGQREKPQRVSKTHEESTWKRLRTILPAKVEERRNLPHKMPAPFPPTPIAVRTPCLFSFCNVIGNAAFKFHKKNSRPERPSIKYNPPSASILLTLLMALFETWQ